MLKSTLRRGAGAHINWSLGGKTMGYSRAAMLLSPCPDYQEQNCCFDHQKCFFVLC